MSTLFIRCTLLIALTQALLACTDSSETTNKLESEPSASTEVIKPVPLAKPPQPYIMTQWEELIPEQDLQALLTPPQYINSIEEGSLADQIGEELNKALTKQDIEYQEALKSTRVNEGFNGKKIRIAGFVVPLEFDDEQRIGEFFLVPYFGACIHVPPPPPNQIIYSTAADKFQLDNLYDPVWLEGTITTTLTENSVARSAYALSVDSVKPYDAQIETPPDNPSDPDFLD